MKVRLITFLAALALVCACTRVSPDPGAHPIDAQGFGGKTEPRSVISLAEFIAGFPETGPNGDGFFCRSLDPRIDPKEVTLMNPVFTDTDPSVDILATDAMPENKLQLELKFSSVFPTESIWTNWGCVYPLCGASAASPTLVTFFNLNEVVMQKYYFGLMLLMKPEWTSGFMVRNVLCRAASELTNYSLEQKAMGIDVSRQKNVTAPPTQIAEQCHALNEEALGLSFWGRERVTQLDGRTEIIRELSGNSECSSIDATQSFVLDASGSLVSSQITPTNGLSAGLLNVLKAHCTRPWKWLEPVDVMHSCN